MTDENVIPLLRELGSVTFFTRDVDYNDRRLCHRAYCLVYLDVKIRWVAVMIRRFLRHPRFRTWADRAGTVVRVHPGGLHVWTRNAKKVEVVAWPKQK